MAEPLPSVSVVMPTFQRSRRLPQVVEPLLGDRAAIEVIVVVDGCDDGSYEWLVERARRDSRLRPIWIANGGANSARLTGADTAKGDVVLLMDDDVQARPGLIEGHARRHASEASLVVVGYMALPGPTGRQAGDFTTDLYAKEYEEVCTRWEEVPGDVLFNLWAGNLSLHRADFLMVAQAATPAAHYHADQELGLRFAKAGLRGVFDRSLQAEHLHARSLAGFVRDARSQGAEQVAIRESHSDLLGPFSAAWMSAGLPPAAQALLRLCRRPRAARLTAKALYGAVVLAGRTRCFRSEELAARLLRRVEHQRETLETA